MKRTVFAILAVLTFATAAFAKKSYSCWSGNITLPSGVSASGTPMFHGYYFISQELYNSITNISEDVFAAWLAGDFSAVDNAAKKEIWSLKRDDSSFEYEPNTFPKEVYLAAVYFYTNAVSGATNYLATTRYAHELPNMDDFDVVRIDNLATDVISNQGWRVIGGIPDKSGISFIDFGVTVTNLVLEIGQPYGELPVPAARAGYLFGGWFTEEGGAGDRIEADSIVPDFDTELYAFWRINTFTVKFAANGGAGTMPAQSIIRDTAAALRANAFTKSGCLFLGWAKTASGAVAYANKAKVKNLAAAGKAVALYAKWAVKKYYVKFKANGGTLPKGKKMPVQTMAYGKAAALTKNAFTRKGYVFMGWAAGAANAKKRIVAFKNGQSVKNLRADGLTLNLYALWAKKEYRVKFHPYGGTGTMPVEVFTYGKAKALNACKFKRPGYKFVGWATSKARAKAGVVKFKNKQSVKNLKSQGETVVLYAVWKKL